MAWEERARKLDAKRRYMRKHGYSVFVMEAAERKRVAEGKVAKPTKKRRGAHGRTPRR